MNESRKIPEFFVRINRRRIPYGLLIVIGLIAVFSYLFATMDTSQMAFNGLLNWIMMGPLVYIFCIVLADYIRSLLSPTAGLAVTAAGVIDSTSVISCGLIPWDRIMSIHTHRVLNTDFLAIRVSDPAELVSRQSSWKRHTLRRYVRKFGTPVVISQKRIQGDIRELASLLEERIGRNRTTFSS
jgi:hypothetical protein